MTDVLDLKQVFGEEVTWKVLWRDGVEYELRRPEALGPEDYVRWEKLLTAGQRLRNSGKKLNAAQAKELEHVTSEAMSLICPDLVDKGLPFLAKVNVIMFYQQKVAAEQAQDPKVEEPQPTGEKSTAS